MITGTTKQGFAFEVDRNVIDDMELLEQIAACDENPMALAKVTKMILGEEQRKRLYDHLRNEQGRVPIKEVSEAISDIFGAFGKDGKN